MMRLIFLGPPGSGKGTQASIICEKFDLTHISTGDLLRQNIKDKTEAGLEAKKYIDRGELVADELVIRMTFDKIEKCDGFVLDGFPRTVYQSQKLDEFCDIDMVISIEVSDQYIIDRITKRLSCACGESYHLELKPPKKTGICDKCGRELYRRDDDNEDTVRKRLLTYKNETEPLKEFYKDRLSKVNGELTIPEVTEEIMKVLTQNSQASPNQTIQQGALRPK